MPGDTTVELIAIHMADILASEHPNEQWKVRAFEGVEKGAIATNR